MMSTTNHVNAGDQYLPDDMDDDTFGFGNSPGNEDEEEMDLEEQGGDNNGRTTDAMTNNQQGQQQNQQSQQGQQRVLDGNDLNTEQKLQLAERANEIYRQQLKYMQDHLASLRSLIQDKENIIENLMLRFDLGIISQDRHRQSGNLPPDEIEHEELRRKAEALAQRTILENFELREMVNELRDENFHLRNEIYELQDKINRQVLQINKLEKANNQQLQSLQVAEQQLLNSFITPGNDVDDDDVPNGSGLMEENDIEEDDDDDGPQYVEEIEAMLNPNMNGHSMYVDEDEDENDENDEDADIYNVNEFAPEDQQPSHDQQTGRRMSKNMAHPANTEKARAERVKRAAESKHHSKKSSVIPPDTFRNINNDSDDDNDNEEEEEEADHMDEASKNGTKRRGSQQMDYVLDEKALAKQAARAEKRHRKQQSSMAAPNIFQKNYDPVKDAENKAKKYSPEAIKKRQRRNAKRVAQAAQNHVVSHRRKVSLVEKLLLGTHEEDPDYDLVNESDPEKRDQLRKEAQKHQRRKSRQILQEKVGDKGHLSDEDAKGLEEEKGQRYDFKMKRSVTTKPGGMAGDISSNYNKKIPTTIAEDPTHHRRDSSAPVADMGFEDVDVLLNYERLKVADLEKVLSQTKDLLDIATVQMNNFKSNAQKVELRTKTAEDACVTYEVQLKYAINSKSELAQKCAMEIMRLTMVLNTLLQIPKYKTTVQMLVDESYRAKSDRNGLI